MANDVNSVTVVGRLTRDCGQQDFSYTQGGTAVARVAVAVNRGRRQADGSYADEASFFDVTIFGKTAENLHPYLQKGRLVAIRGYLKQDRWQDQQTGQSRSRVGIVAEEVQLIGGQPNGAPPNGGQTGGPQQYAPPPGYRQQRQGAGAPPYDGQGFGGADTGFPEDIPF